MFRNGILLIILGIALFALRGVMASDGIPTEEVAMFHGMLLGAGTLAGLGVAMALIGFFKERRSAEG